LGPEPGTLVHPPGGPVGPVLDLVQIFLCASLPKIVLRLVEHIDRRLPHVAGALGSREDVRCPASPTALPSRIESTWRGPRSAIQFRQKCPEMVARPDLCHEKNCPAEYSRQTERTPMRMNIKVAAIAAAFLAAATAAAYA